MTINSACNNMVTQQLRTGEVLNETILNLFYSIPRDDFAPKQFASFGYSDMQIPLGHEQRMFTPLEEGILLQALNLKGHETVLVIGTGSGFLTALLSKLCKKVISVDCYADFNAAAKIKLAKHQCHNVELVDGDGSRGWLENAPYDVIVFTGAMEKLTETQKLQVIPGGKIFAILGKSPIMQGQLHTLSHDEVWSQILLFETDVPLLVDKSKPKDFVF